MTYRLTHMGMTNIPLPQIKCIPSILSKSTFFFHHIIFPCVEEIYQKRKRIIREIHSANGYDVSLPEVEGLTTWKEVICSFVLSCWRLSVCKIWPSSARWGLTFILHKSRDRDWDRRNHVDLSTFTPVDEEDWKALLLWGVCHIAREWVKKAYDIQTLEKGGRQMHDLCRAGTLVA